MDEESEARLRRLEARIEQIEAGLYNAAGEAAFAGLTAGPLFVTMVKLGILPKEAAAQMMDQLMLIMEHRRGGVAGNTASIDHVRSRAEATLRQIQG